MQMIKKYPKIFIVLLIVVLFISFFIAVNLGSIEVSVSQLFRGLFVKYDKDVASVFNIRFPRAIVMIIVGGALAISGLIFQVVLKNPLADPGLLGISSGASLVNMVLSIFFVGLYSVIPFLSFLGGVAVFALIYSLTVKSSFNTTRIILVGVAVNYTLVAIINIIGSATQSLASSAMGSVVLYNWKDVATLSIYLLPFIIISLFTYKACNLLGLEDRTLTSIGVNVNLYRFVMSFIAVVLCSISVAITGVISFVGLIVPHLSRSLIGDRYKYLIPSSILLGSITLLVADTVGRRVFAPYEISASIIMAVIGGPVFIFLLKRSSNAS